MMRYRRLLGFFTTILLLVSLVTPVRAATEELDQSQLDFQTSNINTCTIDLACAQVFTAGKDGGLSRVRLYASNDSGSGDMTVEIRELSGGQPTGTVLASTVVPATSIPAAGSPAWISATFSPKAPVVAGQQYAIYVAAPSGTKHRWYDSRENRYSGGTMWLQDVDQTWDPFSSWDFTFETYLVPAPSARLSDLTLSQGTLSPTFSSATYSYSTSLSNSVTSVVVTPTTEDPNATATVNGNDPSTAVTLATGANKIDVVVTAADGVTTKTYTIDAYRNNLPTVTGLSDQTINEDTSTGTIAFTIGDAETSVDSLLVAATSLDTNIVPVSNITLGGTGADRTIKVTPAANANGTARIQVQVSDSTDVKTQEFKVHVNPVADSPSISSIANLSAPEDSPTTVNFTVGDPDGSLDTLQIAAKSSNQSALPDANISLSGTGSDRSVTFTPVVPNVTVTISITVSDGTYSASTSFDVSVTAVDDPPRISALSDMTIPEDSPSFSFEFTVSDEETAASSLTISALSSNTALVPSGGTITNDNGSVTVTMYPVENATGSSTITVEVSDGAKTTTGSFQLTVTQSNDPPAIDPVPDQSTQEDVTLGPINVTVSDPDSPLSNLVLTATSSNQTLVPNANIIVGGSDSTRTLTITPATNQHGTATINLELNDGISQTKSSFKLTVTSVNDPPFISDIPDLAVAQGDPIDPISFTISDPETSAGSLTVTASSSNQTLVPNSNLKLSGTGTNRALSITPANSEAGQTTITVTASDGLLTTTDTFVLTISQRPTISPLSDVITDEDSPVGPISFTIDDLETPAGQLIVTGTSSNQVLVPDANIVFGGSGNSRTMTITPALDQFGQATITVTVDDGTLTASRSFVLTVNSIDDPPTISPIADVTTQEDVVAGPIPFTAYDPEALGSLILMATSDNQTLVPDGNILLGGSGTDRTVTVIPANEKSGLATITIAATDGSTTVYESFVLTVTNVNDPPQITAPANPSVTEDTSGSFEVSATDVDSPLTNISLAVASFDQTKLPNANIGITAIDTAKWTVTVTPTSNAHGTVTLRLTASDGSASSSRDILLTIVDVNDPPTISAIANQSTNEDVPITGIGFVVGDVETSAENLIITVSSDNSTLLPSSSFVLGGTGTNRTLSITPAEDRYGTAGVFITVDDGTDKVVRTFTVTVNPVPDAPRLKGLADTTIKEDEVLKLPVTVHSPDYPLSSVSISFSSDNQTLVADSAIQLIGTGSSRTLVITPTAEWSGRAVITAVSTADGLTSQQSFALTVEPVNDEPFVTEIPDQEILEGGTTPVLGFTIGDIETPAANLTVSATSSDTAIVPNGNIVLGGSGPIRTIQVTPAPDRFGTVTITVSVSDGEAVGTKSFQVVIENINDAPSFTAGPDVTVNEDAGPQSMPGWATGVTAGPFETAQKLTFTTSVDNPSLFAVEPKVSVGGTLTFTTALHAYGTATVSVQLTDDGSTTNGGVDSSGIQTFVITVTPVNDLPVISEIPNQGTEESMRTERLLFTVSDVESAEASIQVTARSSNQDLVPDENITLGGENGDRWVQIQPVPGWIGTTTITLRASDGEGFSEFSFPLIVNNLKLSALVPSVGQLTPAFNPNTLSYNAFYNGTVTEATLTPAAMDPDVQIWVNGTRVTSNRPSAPQQLTDRGGDVLVVVRAPATGLEKSYSVRFVRELSKDANLVDLSITPGKLAPEFDPEVTSYKATVDPTATDVAVDARPADGRAKVKVTGNTGLQTGTSFIQIEVVAENGERKLYTIEVTRESPQLTFSGDVKVEAGSEWTTLAFGTSDPAKATVHYQTVTGKQETVPSSGGVSHTVSLGPLIPGTTYTYSIVASRSDGSTAHYTSFFTTADTPPSNVCPGGEIRPDGPRTVLVRCPGDEKSTAAAKLAMADTAPTADVTATPVTQLVMGEALKQAGVKGLTEAPATVVVRAEASGKVQSAVVEHAAIQQALRVGASLEVRFNQGSLTLPPTALADLMRENPARLVVLLGEVSPERDDLKPWLEKPFRRISSVVDVSVATLFNDGRVVHHDTFAVPLRLTLNTAAIPQESRKLAGVFWLKEDLTGKASQRLYQGGSVDLERSTISVETGHLSSYVALLFDAQFADVPKSHWAHDVVHQMAARQVVDWPANDLFDPEIPVTRGEVASLLVRALGLETDERFAYVYRDIKVGDPLAGEIGGAIMAGLMMGYPDATFHPEARITRQELAVVLHRVSNRYSRLGIMAMPKTSVQASAYRDWNEVAAWAKDAVQSAMAQGLMTGRAKDTFSPGGITTRAEAVTVVKRLLDWIEGSKEP